MLIVGGNQSAGGYEIANSIRYDQDASQYLRRTCGSSASSYTLSLWVKNCEPQGGSTTAIYWNGTGAKLNWEFNGSSQIYWFDPETRTTGSYRDVSAWYHLVWKVSSNVGTLYVNGSADPGLTSVSSIDSLNSGNFIYLGSDNGGSPQNGYFAEVCFIDGTALDPTSFGEYDEDSGIWKPIDVSGLSFGSNGFYLDFEDSSALGNDVSGNNNDLTSAGFTSLNQSTDTPTNNFATLNINNAYNSTTIAGISEGNLSIGGTASDGGSTSTIGVSSGKWYWELKVINGAGGNPVTGVLNTKGANSVKVSNTQSRTSGSGFWGFYNQLSTRGIMEDGVFSGNFIDSLYASNDIAMLAIDVDAQKIWYGKNGTWFGSGNPATGANASSDNLTANDTWFPYTENRSGYTNIYNFGSPPYTISSGNSDANGYGNFEYAVPSGYYALNTKNLAEYG